MIRTRDFFLFLIVVAFLLVVVSVETARQWLQGTPGDTIATAVPTFDSREQGTTTAEVVAREEIDRAGNIARLRERLASFVPPILDTPQVLSAPEATSTEAVDDDIAAQPTGTALLCAGYRPYAGIWPNQLLTISEQEGVRVVTMNTVVGTVATEQIVAVLSVRTMGNSQNPTCLPTDVVAIAQSGSLIRNADVAGYRAFPEHILIGYTLDGFPLYGNSSQPTDQCGGVVVNGTYRYYLSSARETMLDCFVAPPATLL